MALGFLKISYQSVPLAYHDEKTPIELIGKKMLPIWQDNKVVKNESLEIIDYLDTNNYFNSRQVTSSESFKSYCHKIEQVGTTIHNLVMPYWIYTKEFNEESRKYFLEKKQLKRGPFGELFKKRAVFLVSLEQLLPSLFNFSTPFSQGDKFSLYDVVLASHVWGLYLYPGFQFDTQVHAYLKRIQNIANFDYHEDFWSTV
jgi:glutaredoxin 2